MTSVTECYNFHKICLLYELAILRNEAICAPVGTALSGRSPLRIEVNDQTPLAA